MSRTSVEVETFEALFKEYGEAHQIVMLLEELGRFQSEVCKAIYSRKKRHNRLAESIASLELLVEQLKMILHVDDDMVAMWRLDKVVQLREQVGLYPKYHAGETEE